MIDHSHPSHLAHRSRRDNAPTSASSPPRTALKVTFVLPGGGGGGGARVIVRFAQGLQDRGHHVRILYAHHTPSIRERFRQTYIALRYGRRHDWLRTYAGSASSYSTLTPNAVGHNDFLIAVGVDSVLAIADLPDSCGRKVHNCHGAEPWIADRMQHAWRLSMPRIVSASYLEPLMRGDGSTDPIFVVPNGIDPTEYHPTCPPHARRGIGTVYHGGSPKDPATILAVLHTIHRVRPDVPIRVFGSYPRPSDLPAAATYIRLPTLTKARDLYSQSQVWFCASRHEGFGLPLLEAMACGCAVVSTDCGGPADLIEPGVNGWLVPTGDADGLAQRIAQLLDDRRLLEQFAAAGQEKARRSTWNAAVDRYEQALRCIADDATPVSTISPDRQAPESVGDLSCVRELDTGSAAPTS